MQKSPSKAIQSHSFCHQSIQFAMHLKIHFECVGCNIELWWCVRARIGRNHILDGDKVDCDKVHCGIHTHCATFGMYECNRSICVCFTFHLRFICISFVFSLTTTPTIHLPTHPSIWLELTIQHGLWCFSEAPLFNFNL